MSIEGLKIDFAKSEATSALADFVRVAGLIMTCRGDAERKADEFGFSDRVKRVLKAAVPGGLTSNVGLAAFGPMLGAFMDSLRHVGVFDRILADAFGLPLRPARVLINSSAIVSSEVAEGRAKPVRRLQYTSGDFVPRKVIAQVVLSRELIDGLTETGLAALEREMRASVALGTDTSFLTELGSSNAFESSGSDFDSAFNDLEELVRSVHLGSGSIPYFIVTPTIAKTLSVMAWRNNITTLGIMGGEILGVPVLVTDGQGTGKVTLADATGLAMATGPIDLRASEQASVQLDDAPTNASDVPTATTLVSCFQINSRCLLAERYFSAEAIRPNAVATLTNVQWGSVGDSPVGF
jgi:hypothetical protein